MKAKNLIFFLVVFSTILDTEAKLKNKILPGANQTDAYFPFLKNKVIGIVANQTSVINKTHLVDTLKSSGFNIKCVFAPEHGFRGNKSAGEKLDNSYDSITGIRIVSLYGKHLKPDSNDLKGIDMMVFDIQDVGVRFYTYISTLQYVMEACAENNVPLLLLDRPNPHGFYVDGPVLEKKFTSFVGMQPVPVVYGMTIGEYALMLNGEGWLKDKAKCNLKVIAVGNYYHGSIYQVPIPPSPNLPDMDAIYLYPSVCFFEGTSVSLGRGTNKPFRLIGFPDTASNKVSFKPENIPGVAMEPPYKDTLCVGVDLSGEGANLIKNPGINLKWLLEMYKSFPDKNKFFNSFFDKLAGTTRLRKQISENKTEAEIKKSWQEDLNKFKQIRKKYLLYVDVEKISESK